MKKCIIVLLLAVCLTMAFALPVFAQGQSEFGLGVANTAIKTAAASKGVSVVEYVSEHLPAP